MKGKFESIGIVRIVTAGMAVATVLLSLTAPRQGRAQAKAGAAATQTSAAAPQSFEAASIKPSVVERGTPLDRMEVAPGGRWTASAASLSKLIQTAYDVKPFQISGGPVWLNTERYDIVAKAEMPSINPDELKVLLQSLLAERFKMKFHRETKEIPIYALVVGKNGHKLQESEIQPDAQADARSANPPKSGQKRSIGLAVTGLVGQMVEVSTIADMLTKILDRPVVDKTDIAGYYDFGLQLTKETLINIKAGGKFSGETVNDGSMLPNAPSGYKGIFQAVQDQLGLKLEPRKSPLRSW